MPDITMCSNDDCPLAKKCYRHEAKMSPRQSVSRYEPRTGKLVGGHDVVDCDDFWQLCKGVKGKPCARRSGYLCDHGQCTNCGCKEYCWMD